MRRLAPLVPLVLAAPLLAASSCPLTLDTGQDGGAATDDGGAGDAATTGRRVTFALEPTGELSQTTIDGVTVAPGAFQGIQVITIDDRFGEGQDAWLECGTLLITPPEVHNSMRLTFNDDNGTLLVSAYDQSGVLLTDRAVDTQADAAATGIVAVDQVYKQLVAQMAGGSSRRIARLEIASCFGAVHEIILQ